MDALATVYDALGNGAVEPEALGNHDTDVV